MVVRTEFPNFGQPPAEIPNFAQANRPVLAASNEAGTAASVGVELGKGQAANGLSAAIAAALARDDASNGGKT